MPERFKVTKTEHNADGKGGGDDGNESDHGAQRKLLNLNNGE